MKDGERVDECILEPAMAPEPGHRYYLSLRPGHKGSPKTFQTLFMMQNTDFLKLFCPCCRGKHNINIIIIWISQGHKIRLDISDNTDT